MSLPHEVTHRALVGIRKDVALRCGVGPSQVGNWCIVPRPDGDGEKGPVQRVVEMFWSAVEAGQADRAKDLVSYVTRECAGVYVPLDAVADPTSLDVTAAAVREFGEMLTATAAALGNGHLTASEAEAILPEAEDVLRVVIPFARALQGVIVEDEAARERTRKGPHRAPSTLSTLRSNALRISVA